MLLILKYPCNKESKTQQANQTHLIKHEQIVMATKTFYINASFSKPYLALLGSYIGDDLECIEHANNLKQNNLKESTKIS